MFFLDDFYLCLVSFELLFKRLCCIITEGSLPSNILQHHIKITVTNTFSDDSWSDLNPCSWQIAVVGRILNQDSGQDLRQAQSPVNGMTWQVWGEGEKKSFSVESTFKSLFWVPALGSEGKAGISLEVSSCGFTKILENAWLTSPQRAPGWSSRNSHES